MSVEFKLINFNIYCHLKLIQLAGPRGDRGHKFSPKRHWIVSTAC